MTAEIQAVNTVNTVNRIPAAINVLSIGAKKGRLLQNICFTLNVVNSIHSIHSLNQACFRPFFGFFGGRLLKIGCFWGIRRALFVNTLNTYEYICDQWAHLLWAIIGRCEYPVNTL